MSIKDESPDCSPDVFEVGNNSFGEVYHLALHGILLPDHLRSKFAVHFVGQHRRSMRGFFDDLKIQFQYVHASSDRQNSRGLSETATTILQRFHRDQTQEKTQIIDNLASASGWEVPFTSLKNPDPKVLIWQRNENYEPWRNSPTSLIKQLADLCISKGSVPVIFGPQHGIKGALEFPKFFTDPFFSDPEHNISKQLWFQNALFSHYGLKASIGMMSGVMDGAAMFYGHKTVFFARSTDAQPRMAKVSMAIPGLHWLKTEYNNRLARLSDSALAELQGIIWPDT